MYRVFLLFCVLLVSAFGFSSQAAPQANNPPVSISVSLEPDTIGVDNQAALTITINGVDQNLPAPEMPEIAGIEFYSQGRSSNVSIINGQVSASVTYRFLLLPAAPGSYHIGGIRVEKDGKQYDATPVTLTVLKISPKQQKRVQPDDAIPDSEAGGAGRDYFLDAVVDKKNPYVSEQITLTLKFYTAVQYYGSPQLTEPTTTGFWTEVLGNSAPYFQKVNGRNYRVIERKYALFPTQTGDLTIGRAVIKATVAGRGGKQVDPFDMFGSVFGRGVEVTVSSQPIRVNVKALPDAGKPKNFTGTVGKFTIVARADKEEVEVNQPVTVTFQISGNGNIKSVSEPDLPDLPDFRVYGASSNESVSDTDDRVGGAKQYEKVFIPKRPGDLEIPSINFTFFDPGANQYKTITTKPIHLTVRKAEGYTGDPEIPFSSPSSVTVGKQAQDIRYIRTEIGETQSVGEMLLKTPTYIIINSIPVVVLAGLVIARRRKEHLAANIGYARSRSAGREARKRLAKARSLANLSSSQQFHTEIHRALTTYIADKLNVSPHGLTIDGIESLLRQKGADDALIAGVADIWRKCDFARFAPSSISQESIVSLLAQTEEVMSRIEEVRLG
jgi:hypothetical protein